MCVRKLSLALVLTAVLMVCFTWAAMAIDEGDMLPDFMAKDLKGNDVKISDYRVGYTLYDVWATWCGPCKKSMKSYQQNYAMFEKAGIKIVCVSVDAKIDEPTKWQEKEKAPWAMLHDGTKQTKALWGVNAIPTVFLVDPNGKILFKEIGFDDFATLWKKISSKVKVPTDNFVYPKFKAMGYKAEPVKVDFSELSSNMTLSFMIEDEKDFTKKSDVKLTKEPKYAADPMYGVIRVGKQSFAMAAVDSKNTGFMDTLYVDFNQNLDLTDDKAMEVPKYSNYSEVIFPLNVKTAAGTITYNVDCYSYNKAHKYYMDTATGYQAQISTDAKPVKVLLLDTNANGIFTDKTDVLLIDLDRNGIFDSFSPVYEYVALGDTLKLGNNSYKVEVLLGGKLINIKEVK